MSGLEKSINVEPEVLKELAERLRELLKRCRDDAGKQQDPGGREELLRDRTRDYVCGVDPGLPGLLPVGCLRPHGEDPEVSRGHPGIQQQDHPSAVR